MGTPGFQPHRQQGMAPKGLKEAVVGDRRPARRRPPPSGCVDADAGPTGASTWPPPVGDARHQGAIFPMNLGVAGAGPPETCAPARCGRPPTGRWYPCRAGGPGQPGGLGPVPGHGGARHSGGCHRDYPAAGCTTSPAGLLITRMASSSKTMSRGRSWGLAGLVRRHHRFQPYLLPAPDLVAPPTGLTVEAYPALIDPLLQPAARELGQQTRPGA
jgi:hypothetical protein